MRAAAVAPLRSSSRSGSSGTSGTKAVKKLRKGEGGIGRGRSSDSAAAGSSAQLQQDSRSKGTAFCTPSLPCWAAAERDALEQLTDAFFSRHRLHLRVWPVSAGSGATAGEPAAGTAARTPAAGGSGSYSRSAGGGGGVAGRRGRAATAAASGREEQSRKEGRGSSAQERKASAEGEPLRRAGSVGAAGGPAAAAAERSSNRRASIQKSRATAAAAETSVLQQAENMRKVKHEETANEEEDEATKVRREQLLNVRAMLYDRVTENVSFTCTEYNTPSKPSRNAKLPGFLQLRGIRASGRATVPSCGGNVAAGNSLGRPDPAAAEDAGDAGRGGEANGGPENVEAVQPTRLRQVLQKEDGTTAEDELKHEGGSCSESGTSDAGAGNVKEAGGGAEQQQRDGSSSGRWPQPQQGAPAAAGTGGKKYAKTALQKEEAVDTGSSSAGAELRHTSSKQAWNQVHQDAPGDTDACGDPGKLRELQQSLLSDGFTGCWVLLLTEKYVPPTSPTALSPQHANHRVDQASAASSFAPPMQMQRRLSAGEQSTARPAAAEAAAEEGTAAASGQSVAGADAGECGDAAGSRGTRQQEVVQQESQQQRQPRVRRIIVCGALIEVYSNNERQIAALWCLPCLSAHATRLLLQAFLPRVLLEALRIPDVVATPDEDEQVEERIYALQARDNSGSKKRKWRQDAGLREAGKGVEHKQQARQQRSSGGGGNFQKRTSGEEGHAKQQNGYYLDGGEKGRRRKSSGAVEEAENVNVSAVRRGEGRSGTELCEAVKEEAEQPQQLLRPIKSVFAVYEDILLWPRQALFLLAASSRLGFMRHAEPLLGVPADDEEENVTVISRKNTGSDEKHRGNLGYRKQPYLHVDAGLGPQWRECNCRSRFFSSRLQFAQQRRRKGAASSSSKGGGPAAAGVGKAGTAEEASSSSSRRGGGGAAAAATAASSGGTSNASASRRDSCCSREASPNGDGLLRFFSVSDLWAARLMPPREKRAALQQAEATGAQRPGAAAATQRKQGSGREAEGGNSSSSTVKLVDGTSTGEKPADMDQNQTEVEAMGESCSSRGETMKQEEMREKKAETDTAAAAKVLPDSVGGAAGQEAMWSSEQKGDKRMKRENADTSSSKFWPEATDGWSCLVPRGTSEQILREIYCDLPVLSETNFEECLAEEVDVNQDEMCGLPESECRELLRWWDK